MFSLRDSRLGATSEGGTKMQIVLSTTRLDTVQRKMLRRMVGWARSSDDSWEALGRRMKLRLQNALEKFPIDDWSRILRDRKVSLIENQWLWPCLTQLA